MLQISFVVPVYNAEKYLRPCLDSLVCQTEDAELILVDDGSTDASGAICDEYAEKFAGVKVLHTENGGASRARNLGAATAQGRYIAFVDSDDYINPDFASAFKETDMTADVVFYPVQKLLVNETFIPMADGMRAEAVRNKKATEVLAHIAGCSKFPASPWGKLVRRDFLEEFRISFGFDRTSEDYDWTYQLLRYARTYDYFEEGRYVYRQIPQSRSSMGKPKSVEDQITILTHWEMLDVEEGYKAYLHCFLAYEYAMILPFYGALSKADRRLFSEKMHRCAYLLRYGKTGKLKLIRYACTLLGVEMTASLLYRYISRRNKRYGKQ